MDDLVTQRLLIHRLSIGEVGGVTAGQPVGGARWAPEYPTEGDVSAARLFLRCCAEGNGALHPGVFEIRRREDGCAIGGIGFHGPADEDGAVTVGYRLVPSARGRGYASEALRALLAFARDIGIVCVKGDADQGNSASQYVMAAAGMRLVGQDEQVRYYEALWTDASAVTGPA